MKSGITFTWEGMEQANAEADTKTEKRFSADVDIDSNLFIEGDNLDVLKLLNAQNYQPDIVYIDPPYNTGKSSYSYKNNFNNTAQGVPRPQAPKAIGGGGIALFFSLFCL